MPKRLAVVCVVALLVLAGVVYEVATNSASSGTTAGVAPGGRNCGTKHRTCSPSPTPTSPKPTVSGSTTPVPPSAGRKVMVIIEENHSRVEALANMPHLAAWASRYGQATHYTAMTHPSLPNYLAIGGGSTFGVTDDNPPSSHPVSGASVFGQTLAAGKTAKVYAESMPTNCALTNSGSYAVRHNEWTYFSAATERSGCNANNRPMGTTSSGNLVSDINAGKLPVTGQMTPNLCNDAHNCSLATADTWLNAWVPKLMAGPDYTSGNLTIVITFDEDDSSAANNIPFVVINPRLAGKTVTTAANHYSLTRWLNTNAGTALLRNAATAPDLKSAFGL
jgi:hypothetical protein